MWQVEQSAFCRAVLAKHWPHAQRFTDVREVGAHNLEAVDVICGGYPCQPFSTSGKQLGSDDPRHLWPEFARVLGELRPRIAVLENVANHAVDGFDAVLADLAGLGYDAEWSVVSACAVGTTHPRPRLFAVAYPAGLGQPEPWERGSDASDHATATAWQTDRLVDAVRRGALPFLCREDDGVPGRMDRLHALGNAVVPQVAEIVGRRLLDIHRGLSV